VNIKVDGEWLSGYNQKVYGAGEREEPLASGQGTRNQKNTNVKMESSGWGSTFRKGKQNGN